MWKMRRLTDGDCIVLNISGRIEEEELSELEKAVRSEKAAPQKVELDLEQVKLVDQQAVTFFACCEASGIRIRNCPPYIREWIARERAGKDYKREQ